MSDQDTLESGSRDAQAANLFDLRRIIGGLFGIYGVILVVVGITDGSKEIARAAGVHINLLAGIGMLVLSAIFWIWAITRPLSDQLGERERS
jgi:drug/metabolite transporter (DMT)-like permease